MDLNLLRNRLTFGRNYGRISSVVRHNADAVVAQLDRALGYGPRCREFESSHARFINEKDRIYILSFFVNKAPQKMQTGCLISVILKNFVLKGDLAVRD